MMINKNKCSSLQILIKQRILLRRSQLLKQQQQSKFRNSLFVRNLFVLLVLLTITTLLLPSYDAFQPTNTHRYYSNYMYYQQSNNIIPKLALQPSVVPRNDGRICNTILSSSSILLSPPRRSIIRSSSSSSFLRSSIRNEDDDDDDDIDIINGDAEDDEVLYAPNSDNAMYITESEQADRANEMIATTLLTTRTNPGEIELQDEISNSFLQYALSIIMGRAIPDARDGLKPVHRRILYAMDQLNLVPGSSHRKCARVVGEVLGKYHPHGDIAVYDALVRMVQDFSSNHPVIDGHGNFGSIDADPAAAMRYTECRLTPLAQQTLLGDDYDSSIKSGNTNTNEYPIVDFIPNFDGNEIEPTVLPAKIPFLLLNGASGIAVGMATNIPPHNLKELMDACMTMVSYRKSDDIITDDELFSLVPGPDFPTGASILGTTSAKQLYKVGHGGITMRAITHVESNYGSKKQQATSTSTGGRNAIVVTELPYQVNKAALLQKIAALVNEKKLEGISDLRDESDRDGIRVVIELKRDAVPEIVLKNLYLKTSLQTSFAGNFLALMSPLSSTTSSSSTATNDGDDTTTSSSSTALSPQRFTLRQALDCFLNFRFETIRKKTKYQLGKVVQRIHIVDGLLRALTDIDAVIQVIRTAPDQASARIALQEKLQTSVTQTDAILKLQLGQLTRLNSNKLQLEKTDLQNRQKDLQDLLTVDNTVYDTMINEFKEIHTKFGRDRRSVIIPNDESTETITDLDLIRNSRSVIVVTHGGYIKRLPLKTFESQGRGTRGKRGTSSSSSSMETTSTTTATLTTTINGAPTKNSRRRDEDVAHCFTCNDHDTLLMVSQSGVAFGVRAYQIPIAGRTARGQPIPSVLQALSPTDAITSILPVSEFSSNDYLLLTTDHGWIKKTSLDAFAKMSSRGLVASKMDPGDRLRWCQQVRDDEEILVCTTKGRATRFSAGTLRPTSRTSRGVRAMNLKNNDRIAAVNIVRNNNTDTVLPDEQEYALLVTAKGFGKLVPTSEFPTIARGGVGVIAIKFKSASGPDERVSSLLVVTKQDEILVTTAKGIMLRQQVSDIPAQGRYATGATIQKLDDGDEIVNVSVIPINEDSE